MRGWGNIFQLKEQDETSEKEPSETGTSNLPNKQFKVMVLNLYIELGRWVDKHSESLNTDRKYLKISNRSYYELKNILEVLNNRLDKIEEWISELEDKVMNSDKREK